MTLYLKALHIQQQPAGQFLPVSSCLNQRHQNLLLTKHTHRASVSVSGVFGSPSRCSYIGQCPQLTFTLFMKPIQVKFLAGGHDKPWSLRFWIRRVLAVVCAEQIRASGPRDGGPALALSLISHDGRPTDPAALKANWRDNFIPQSQWHGAQKSRGRSFKLPH